MSKLNFTFTCKTVIKADLHFGCIWGNMPTFYAYVSLSNRLTYKKEKKKQITSITLVVVCCRIYISIVFVKLNVPSEQKSTVHNAW